MDRVVEEPRGRMMIVSPGRGIGGFARFGVTVAALLAIALVTGWFAVKTNGGRAFIEEKLKKRLGMPLTVAKTRIGFPYVLVAEDVVSPDYGASGKPGIKAQEVRFALGIHPVWRVSVKKGSLILVRDGQGRWHPDVFSALGDLPKKTIAELSRATADWREDMKLKLREGAVDWIAEDGGTLASARGVSLDVCPVDIPGHTMYDYRLSVYSSVGADGEPAQDVEVEWLAGERHDYIEIGRAGFAQGADENSFWNANMLPSGQSEVRESSAGARAGEAP